jgi:hypothetical protein
VPKRNETVEKRTKTVIPATESALRERRINNLGSIFFANRVRKEFFNSLKSFRPSFGQPTIHSESSIHRRRNIEGKRPSSWH